MRLQRASSESKQLAILQATKSSNTRSHTSSNEEVNKEEICFNEQAKIAIFMAKI